MSSDSKWSKVHTKSQPICLTVQLRIGKGTHVSRLIVANNSPNQSSRLHSIFIFKQYIKLIKCDTFHCWEDRVKGKDAIQRSSVGTKSGGLSLSVTGIINEPHQTTHEILPGSSGLGSSSYWLSSSYQPCLTSRFDIITIIHHQEEKLFFSRR